MVFKMQMVIIFYSEQRLLDLGDEGRSTDTFELGLLRYYLKLVFPLFDLLHRRPDSAVSVLVIEGVQLPFVGFVIDVNYLTVLDVRPVVSIHSHLVVSVLGWTHVVGARVEAPHNINVALWQHQLHEPQAKSFYYGVENAPDADERSPRHG